MLQRVLRFCLHMTRTAGLFLLACIAAIGQEAVPRPLPLSASSYKWTVQKQKGKIWARNSATNARKVVFADVDKEDEISRYEVVSLVGPVLSVAESLYWEGGAHPGHLTRLETVNLDTGGHPVRLTDLFPEKRILAALLQDRVVRKALGENEPKSLAALIDAADGGCEMSFLFLDESFSFHHLQGDRIAVRIGLPHGCELMRGNYTELGIYLKIPDELRACVENAEKQRTLGIHTKTRPTPI